MSEKEIILASPRGFCAGVSRAVTTVEKLVDRKDSPQIYILNEIVHNKFVVEQLQNKGVCFVKSIDNVPSKSLLVFPAHGVCPEIIEIAKNRNLTIVNATCPLVMQLHNQVLSYAKKDYTILLIGHSGHEEVIASVAQSKDRVVVIEPKDILKNNNFADFLIEKVEKAVENFNPNKAVWLSQTTLNAQEVDLVIKKIKTVFTHLNDPKKSGICYATQNRQKATIELVKKADLVLIVGSKNSSNTMRLLEVAKQTMPNKLAFRVDNASELKAIFSNKELEYCSNIRKIGITSGASVPQILVEGIVLELKKYGFNAVSTLETVKETLNFPLPI